MPVLKYKKLPVIVEACQYTGTKVSRVEICEWVGEAANTFGSKLTIKTLEGPMNVSIADYVIKGVAGEFYPCKPEIFWKTYGEYHG